MNVLLLASSPASLLNFRLDLIKDLQSLGYGVHVTYPCDNYDGDERKLLERCNVVGHAVPISRTGLNPFSDVATLFSLYRLMIKIRPFAVLSYTIKPVLWGSLAAYLARVPRRFALITGLGYAFVEGAAPDRKRKFVRVVAEYLYTLALNRCDLVFFQNPDDESLFRQLKILKSSVPSSVVMGSGVNLSYFKSAPLPSNPVFVMVARLLVDKGVRQYAQAACRLKAKYPAAKFVLVGYLDANPESIKQSELDAWVQAGNIEYLGKLAVVRPAIAAASVFVLPTFYREGIPRTILEALAMGRAIVTTDTPGCRETVEHGINGYLIKSKSVDELVDALERLILEPNLIVSMGRASSRLARDEFDVRKVNAQMLDGMKLNG